MQLPYPPSLTLWERIKAKLFYNIPYYVLYYQSYIGPYYYFSYKDYTIINDGVPFTRIDPYFNLPLIREDFANFINIQYSIHPIRSLFVCVMLLIIDSYCTEQQWNIEKIRLVWTINLEYNMASIKIYQTYISKTCKSYAVFLNKLSH